MDVEGFVLAGGASSRMGRDKARLAIGGYSLLERAVRTLSEVCGRVRVADGSGNKMIRLGGGIVVETVSDISRVEQSSLRGLRSVLGHGTTEWTAVLACDLPFVTSVFFGRLLEFAAGRDGAVPLQPDGRIQPLCAVYRRTACLAAADLMLRTNERRLQKIVEHIDVHTLLPKEYGDLPGAEHFFVNVNSPDDLAAALKISDEIMPPPQMP